MNLMLAVHRQIVRDALGDDEVLDDWTTAEVSGKFEGREVRGPIAIELVHGVTTRYRITTQAEVLERSPEIPRDEFGPGTLLVLVTDQVGRSWFRLPMAELEGLK